MKTQPSWDSLQNPKLCSSVQHLVAWELTRTNTWGIFRPSFPFGYSWCVDMFSLVLLLFHRDEIQAQCSALPMQHSTASVQHLHHSELLRTEEEPLSRNHVPRYLPVLRPQLFRASHHLFQPVFIDWVNNSLDYSSYSFPWGYIWQQPAHPSLTALLIRRPVFPFLSKAAKLHATGILSSPFS